MNKEKRFEIVTKESSGLGTQVVQVIVDKETGVNYLFVEMGYSGGLTVLVDENGKPIVTK